MEMQRFIPGWQRRWVLGLLPVLLVLGACTPSRYVRPLAKGEIAVSASLGGPIFTNFGAPIPAPMTTLTGAYGFSNDLTGFASFHPTSAAFGVLQLDLGIGRSLLRPDGWRPGVTLNPTAGLALDVWEGNFKFWPQIDLNAWWEYGQRRHYVYGGFSVWMELASNRAHGEPQPQTLLPAFQLGNVLSFNSIDLQIEVKANNFTRPNQDATISWVGFAGRGGIGVYLGISKRFGGTKP
ncbi:MAG: hypothetical protein AAGN35_09825 [Bacteroidota bacterium]